MQPGRYTELFFLDDATAMAAGHRACALCRREDHERLCVIWRSLHPADRGADEVDATLHVERWDGAARAQRHHEAAFEDLPDGTFVLVDGVPWLLHGEHLRRWAPAGYGDRVPRPRAGAARVITPPSLVGVLRAGWEPLVPLLHPSALEG